MTSRYDQRRFERPRDGRERAVRDLPDNHGDAKEDLTLQIKFRSVFKPIALPIGHQTVPIPLTPAGQVSSPNAAALNVNEKITLNIARGDRRTGAFAAVTNAAGGSATFHKPSDGIGLKTIADFSFGASGRAAFGAGFANLTSVSFFDTSCLTLDDIGVQTLALDLIPEALP